MVVRFLVIILALVASIAVSTVAVFASQSGKLVILYDRGVKTTFVSQDKTIGEALKSHGIELGEFDAVEPSANEEMVASEYHVNIYRARPVTVIDGGTRLDVLTPYQSSGRIADSVGLGLFPEDKISLLQSRDFLAEGPGLVLKIDRAKDFTLDLYGKTTKLRTHKHNVGQMIKENNISLGVNDRVSVELESLLEKGMHIRIWREGKQTIAEDKPISYGTEFVYDADRPVGFRDIKTPGSMGVNSVTYEIEIKDGQEIYRKEIAKITTKQPKSQQVSIGIKGLENGLVKSRGVVHSKDSKGIVHRETYYDLNMRVVMNSCGQGGRYSVRFDGMKIDSDGYIIVAANYAKYPKCSVVETSAGLGKVYDTGGFVARHPDGFDLATDWTKQDGI